MGTIYRNGQYYGGSSGGATAELDRHEIGYGNDESNIVGSGLFTKKNANIVEDLCEEQQSNSLEFIIDSTTDGDMPAGTITISNGTLETDYDSTQYVKDYEGHGYIGPILYQVTSGQNYGIKFSFETFNKVLADKDYYLSFIGYEDYANLSFHKTVESVTESGATVYNVTCTANTKDAFEGQIVFPPTTGQDLAIYNGNADQDGGKFFLKNKGTLNIGGNNLTSLDGNTRFTMHDSAVIDLTGGVDRPDAGPKIYMHGNTTIISDDNSTVVMRGNLPIVNGKKKKPWTDVVVNWTRPVQSKGDSPIVGLYDAPTVLIRGTWDTEDDDAINPKPEDWVEHPEKQEGSPVVEIIEDSELRFYGSSSIKMDDEGITFGNTTGTASFTIEELNNLKNGSGGGTGGDNPPYELPIASETELGGVKIGEGINMAEDGTISVEIPESSEPYELPAATNTTLGGVKIGKGLSINDNGVLSANAQELTPATEETLGGIKIGSGLEVLEDGTVNVIGGNSDKNIEYVGKNGIEIYEQFKDTEIYDLLSNGSSSEYGWVNKSYPSSTAPNPIPWGKELLLTKHIPINTKEVKAISVKIVGTDGSVGGYGYSVHFYDAADRHFNTLISEPGVYDLGDGIHKFTRIDEFENTSYIGLGVRNYPSGTDNISLSSIYSIQLALYYSEESINYVELKHSDALEINKNGELDLKIKIIPCTQEQYDALEVKDPNTLYLIGD